MKFSLLIAAAALAFPTLLTAQTISEDGVLTECNMLSGEYRIPDGVRAVGEGAFTNSGVTKVIVPPSVEEFRTGAFYLTVGLSSVEFEPGSKLHTVGQLAFSECISLQTIALPEGVKTIGRNAFTFCDELNSITLPSTIERIEYSAISSCPKLKRLDLPSKLQVIEDFAFAHCTGLLRINIPSADSIGSKFLYKCENLTSVTLPNNLKVLGDSAFMRCTSLETMNLPASVEKVGDKLFLRTPDFQGFTVDPGNENFTAVNGVLYTKDMAILKECPQKFITDKFVVPESVKVIRPMAFYECNAVQGISIPEGIEGIGLGALNYNGIKEIEFPGNDLYFMHQGNLYRELSDRRGYALMAVPTKSTGDSLIVLTGTSYIADYAAMSCTSRKLLYIPEGILAVGPMAFKGCTGLKHIYAYPKTAPQLSEESFAEIPFNEIELHTYPEAAESYQLRNWLFPFGSDINEPYPLSGGGAAVTEILPVPIHISRVGNVLSITSEEPIHTVSVYDFQGRRLTNSSVGGNVTQVTAEGPCIVRLVTASGRTHTGKY